MSVNWRWADKCGTLTLADGNELALYEGNALLIALHEYEEDGHGYYTMHSFWADKPHAKRMLGLAKNYDGDRYNCYSNVTKVRINKKKHSKYKDIVTLFAQALDHVDIEVYSDDEVKQ